MVEMGGTSSLNINPILGINFKIFQHEKKKPTKVYYREESSISY